MNVVLGLAIKSLALYSEDECLHPWKWDKGNKITTKGEPKMYFLHRHRPTSLRIFFAAERIMNASLKKNGIDKNIYNNNINNNDNNNININDNKYNHISIKHVKNNININNRFLSWSILIKIFFISSNKNMPV